MIWIVFAGFAGVVVVAVSAWARSERKKTDNAAAARRERAQLDAEETRLLERLRRERDAGETR